MRITQLFDCSRKTDKKFNGKTQSRLLKGNEVPRLNCHAAICSRLAKYTTQKGN